MVRFFFRRLFAYFARILVLLGGGLFLHFGVSFLRATLSVCVVSCRFFAGFSGPLSPLFDFDFDVVVHLFQPAIPRGYPCAISPVNVATRSKRHVFYVYTPYT